MKRLLWLLAPLLLITSCTSTQYYKKASKAFDRGEYPESARMVLVSLEANPENQDSILLLEKAFPLAVERLKENIEEARSSNDKFRWSLIADSYAFIHNINDKYQALPSLYHKKQDRRISLSVQYFHQEYSQAKEKAAEEQYQAALDLEKSEDKEELRQAVRYFQKAVFYVSFYKDSLDRMESIMETASDIVLLLPQDDSSLSYKQWPIRESFYSDLRAELFQGSREKDFMIMVDRSNLDLILAEQKLSLTGIGSSETMLKIGEISNADTLVTYNIVYISYNEEEKDYWLENRESGPDDENPDAPFLSVEIQHWTSSSSVELRAEYKIINIENSKIIDTRQIRSNMEDSVSWIEAEGDKALLNDGELSELQYPESRLLDYNDLLENAAEKLAEDMAEAILANFE